MAWRPLQRESQHSPRSLPSSSQLLGGRGGVLFLTQSGQLRGTRESLATWELSAELIFIQGLETVMIFFLIDSSNCKSI